MRKEKISILIPAYNEEEVIVSTIGETVKVLEELNFDFEVIVIDDGSNDNTYIYVQENLKYFNNKVTIKKYCSNKGKGFAIKHGCNYITGDYVLFLDADMDLHPSQINSFLSIIKKEETDLVLGS
ncbi:MAG: glycosyltransferase family 2 protein, partial [Actinobacteria bacterium]|nr:glycosyltransferase family 2 protein [Actinomycetota bacterium]